MPSSSEQLVTLTLFGDQASPPRHPPPAHKRARPANTTELRFAAIVRGVLIQRLEDRQDQIQTAVKRAMVAVGPTASPDVFVARLANEIVYEVCTAFFPEEFAEPDDPPRLPDRSLVPDRPLPRCGEKHLEAFVKRLKGA